MFKITINKKSKSAIAIASILLVFAPSFSFVNAQPQIPNYNLPPDQQNNLDITIPSDPSNPGVPGTGPTIAPTPTPEPQPDYTPIAIAIVIAAVIIAGLVAWSITKKRKTLPPLPPT